MPRQIDANFTHSNPVLETIWENIQQLEDVIQSQASQADIGFISDTSDLLEALQQQFQIIKNQSEQNADRLSQFETLIELSNLLNSGLNVSQVLEKIIDSVVLLTGAERAYLMLQDENNRLNIAIARNWNKATLSEDEVKYSRTVIDGVLQTGKARVISNAQSDTSTQNAKSVVQLHFLSIFCIPLISQDKIIGVLYADNNHEQDVFSTENIPVLTAFASQAAIALENAHLYEQIKSNLNSLDTMRDAERRRLRNDLHDGIGSTLAAINLGLDRTRSLISNNPGRAAEVLLEVKSDVQQSIAVIRQVIEELRPPELEKGLLVALRERFERFNSFETVHIEFLEPPFLPRLSDHVAANLYLIALEAVTNVIRHAHATECRVEFIVYETGIRLSVDDNGRGFQPAQVDGTGVTSIKQRVKDLGGSYSIDSNPSKGTYLLIEAPFVKVNSIT
ncbi:MAG: GAF domain-containing protein [Anaerolineaceae bacterium]|nr:GAF domain-containing protein [Anaerolineaceae bacterium]